MEETKEKHHTPGPWSCRYRFCEGGRDNSPLDVYAVTADLANLTIVETKFSTREDEANAHLIAAAPDLLAACKKALDFMINLKVELGQYMPFVEVQALERAIAKAEGQD